MAWTLADIKQKLRNVTGRPDATQMSDAILLDYINKYYQFALTKELKIFFDYTYYTFLTSNNIDVYSLPGNFQTLNPPAYIDGFSLTWYTDPELFYQDYPQQESQVNVALGDGATSTFAFALPSFPVIRGTVYITDGIQTAQDNSLGSFTGNTSAGNINYLTGSVSITFTSPPATGANITAKFQQYIGNRPAGILYFNNNFTLRPIPDQVYLVKMEGLPIPTAFVNNTDKAFREDLGPLIAYGASLEIFSDFDQQDQYQEALIQYNRYKDIALTDTYEVMLYQRAYPKF